ncbi:MAG TPA: class I SAM-dependent methyltransferase [Segetibacter sp.]|jgi:ubiquinone/menaquinone biosynthesis C-methylase UbiE
MDLQLLAAQLRKPEGETGKHIGELMNNGNRLINVWTIDALDLQEEDSVLEIGMGNGFFVKDILTSKRNVRYVGLDYSEVMTEEAKEMNVTFLKSGKAEFLLGTADLLPFADETFSKVFTINTIYFWGNASKELTEVKRVLRPGGKFVIAVRSKETMQQMPFTEFGFIKYDEQELVAVLEHNAFKITYINRQKEPAFDFDGQQMQLENIIVSCTR